MFRMIKLPSIIYQDNQATLLIGGLLSHSMPNFYTSTFKLLVGFTQLWECCLDVSHMIALLEAKLGEMYMIHLDKELSPN